MQIDVDYPFDDKWDTAYVTINREPRRNVILTNKSGERITIPYARYLYQVYHGVILNRDELVDHINEDKLDDRISNYQILSTEENTVKSNYYRGVGKAMVEFKCGGCSKIFSKEKRNTHIVKGGRSSYCSRSCGSNNYNKPSSILREYIDIIPYTGR